MPLILRRNLSLRRSLRAEDSLEAFAVLQKTRIHNTQATSAGAMVPGDIVR